MNEKLRTKQVIKAIVIFLAVISNTLKSVLLQNIAVIHCQKADEK